VVRRAGGVVLARAEPLDITTKAHPMEGTSNPIRDPRVAVAPEVQVDFHNTFASFTNAVLALVRGSFACSLVQCLYDVARLCGLRLGGGASVGARLLCMSFSIVSFLCC